MQKNIPPVISSISHRFNLVNQELLEFYLSKICLKYILYERLLDLKFQNTLIKVSNQNSLRYNYKITGTNNDDLFLIIKANLDCLCIDYVVMKNYSLECDDNTNKSKIKVKYMFLLNSFKPKKTKSVVKDKFGNRILPVVDYNDYKTIMKNRNNGGFGLPYCIESNKNKNLTNLHYSTDIPYQAESYKSQAQYACEYVLDVTSLCFTDLDFHLISQSYDKLIGKNKSLSDTLGVKTISSAITNYLNL